MFLIKNKNDEICQLKDDVILRSLISGNAFSSCDLVNALFASNSYNAIFLTRFSYDRVLHTSRLKQSFLAKVYNIFSKCRAL